MYPNTFPTLWRTKRNQEKIRDTPFASARKFSDTNAESFRDNHQCIERKSFDKLTPPRFSAVLFFRGVSANLFMPRSSFTSVSATFQPIMHASWPSFAFSVFFCWKGNFVIPHIYPSIIGHYLSLAYPRLYFSLVYSTFLPSTMLAFSCLSHFLFSRIQRKTLWYPSDFYK